MGFVIRIWIGIYMIMVMQQVYAQTVTTVLQNGNSGYEGCKDSYTISDGKDVNYGDNPFICHKNCQT